MHNLKVKLINNFSFCLHKYKDILQHLATTYFLKTEPA